MLSYPHANDRGLYLGELYLPRLYLIMGTYICLGIWSAMRSSGSVLGGAINFATNYTDSSAGGIAWSTYLIFVAFGEFVDTPWYDLQLIVIRNSESTGPIWAFLLSPTRKVRRSDGSRVPFSPDLSWAREFGALWKHALQRKVCFSILGSDSGGHPLIVPHSDVAHVRSGFLLFLLRRCIWDVPQFTFLNSS
jgi:hypothetical protein